MRFRMRSRCGSWLLAVGYLLTISTASLFHDHSGCEHGHSSQGSTADRHGDSHAEGHPGAKPSHNPPRTPANDGDCPVCQYLAQKAASTPDAAAADAGDFVQDAYTPPQHFSSPDAFSAWHSRGPPAIA
jgi:hypothetical protein